MTSVGQAQLPPAKPDLERMTAAEKDAAMAPKAPFLAMDSLGAGFICPQFPPAFLPRRAFLGKGNPCHPPGFSLPDPSPPPPPSQTKSN